MRGRGERQRENKEAVNGREKGRKVIERVKETEKDTAMEMKWRE